MEVKIGVLHTPREITLESNQTPAEVEQLVAAALHDHPHEQQISLLAISVANLVDQPVLQLELPLLPEAVERPGSRLGAARWAVDHSVDSVRARFGRGAVGYAAVALGRHGSVPDEFRELAEHEL